MARFEYQARTRTGEMVAGHVDAPDRRAALARIDQLGYFPVSVDTPAAVAGGAGRSRRRPLAIGRKGRDRAASGDRGGDRPRRIGRRDVLIFTQQLSNLLRSGMSLVASLEALARQAKGRPMEPVISDLVAEIRQGTNLSDALAKYPKTFPNLYSSMVQAGEASGQLPAILQRLQEYYERSQELREKIVGAMIYPIIIMVVGLGLVIFVMTFMVPRFEILFSDMNATLPLPTRVLMSLSSATVHYGWLAALAVVGAVIGIRQLGRTEAGRLWIDGFKLRVPLVGQIAAKGIYAHLARTLGTLLANGVEVLDALRIVERTINNAVIRRELVQARGRVTDGATIAQPLAAGRVFPQLLTDMLAVGEETGDLPGTLDHIADMYEQELSRDIKIFTTLLEPLMIIFMAVLVGGVVFSILIAVFQMTSGLNM